MITKERIKALAQETGFHACGITLPKLVPEAEEAFKNWNQEGKHGEMKYLENYESRRDRFWKSFEKAKSVIVLGVNYFSKTKVNGAGSGQDRFLGTNSISSPLMGEDKGGGDFIPPILTFPHKGGRNRTGTDSLLTGRVARYAWGKDYHRVIARKLETLKEEIGEAAGREVHFESAVDTKPLLERALGQQAGFGFIGKQTQLLSLQFGPWLFLSELVTDLELEPDEPFHGSCGTCRLCIDECPTEAIEETGHIDARKCIAYLTIEHKTEIPLELRSKIGNWVFGCDECLNVCPYTAKQKETNWTELTRENGFGPELDLLELFEIKSNREYQKKFAQSPISRANRKQLLRNAAVVLGNSGSARALPILEKALTDASPLVREHVRWAMDQIRESASECVS